MLKRFRKLIAGFLRRLARYIDTDTLVRTNGKFMDIKVKIDPNVPDGVMWLVPPEQEPEIKKGYES